MEPRPIAPDPARGAESPTMIDGSRIMPPMDRRPDLLDALRPHPALDALAGEPGVHVVGGAVRDALLGRTPHELDLVVEGDAPAVARRAGARLGARVLVHERFGTATVDAPGARFDLASARRERYPHPGALPVVELGATLEEDLARRDVTVNAIALALDGAAMTAWPSALDDVRDGVLRVLHDASFRDDPTRMLRLARYAGRLGFEPDPHTDALLADAVGGGAAATVSGERLGEELRLLAAEPQPAALAALERHGLGAAVLHPAFAVDPALVSRVLSLVPGDARADLAALAATVRAVPAGELTAALERLAFPAAERDLVLAAATAWPLRGADDDAALWTALRRMPPEAVAVAGAAGDPAAARRWLDDVRHRTLAITGDDLVAAGVHGPAVGAGLVAAMEAHLRGEAADREAQLAAALATAR
jgi:tRNA nucleotidyltransferase (CCA-adding enzyme)